jgi:hypothetical protein
VGARVAGRVDERIPVTLRITTQKPGRDLVVVARAPAF